MKITDSSVLMGSQRTYTEVTEERTNLRFWIDAPRAATTDRVSISREAARACQGCMPAEDMGADEDLLQDMGLEVTLKRLITEILSGRKVKVMRTEDLSQEQGTTAPAEPAGAGESSETSEGWGLDYSHETLYREKEAVSFDAKGVVRTADGKEIAFSLRLDMSREYMEANSVRIRAGDALKDPLIINFEGTAAQLSRDTVAFDIDADGIDDQLPMLAGLRGYLAMDVNGDGIITDGGELFGPSTGNGFKELAAYDSDGNLWIDENDEAFSRLSVLTFDAQGNQVLGSLKDRGVGAVYTPSSATQFDLKDQASGELLGRVQSSGIYLAENGSAGTIQQVDLKV